MKILDFEKFSFNWRLHLLPVLIWLSAVIVISFLFLNQSERIEVVGIARSEIHRIGTTCDGRLKSLNVGLYQTVKAGQTVAVIDTVLDNEQLLEADLNQQLATAEAQIEYLTALAIKTQDTMMADQTERQINLSSEARLFLVDTDKAKIQILELKAQIASDKVLLADLESEVKISQKLLDEKAIAEYELKKAQVQYESLAKKIEENQRVLEQAEQAYKQAQERLSEFTNHQLTNPSVDSAVDVIKKQIEVQKVLKQGLAQQLEALKSRRAVEIKTPVEGIVISIQNRAKQATSLRPGEDVIRRTGEVVRAGDSILEVAELKPSEIVAYINESQLGQIQEKDKVEIVKNRTPAQKIRCEVLLVSPIMELLPEQLWLNPNTPRWGRPVIIKIPDNIELVSGETVGVRIL
jgi:multidrug resistance efflux pump